MTFLDMRTVFFSYIISNMICMLVILYLWMQHRRRSEGVDLWLAGYVCNFFAVFLIALRGVIPDFLSIVVGGVLVSGVIFFLCTGVERYVGIRRKQYWNYFFLAVFTIVQVFFTYPVPSLFARKINISSIIVLICFPTAWRLLRSSDPQIRRIVITAGVVLSASCLISFMQIFVNVILPQGSDFFRPGVYVAAIIMAYQMLQVAVTFLIILMVNGRLFSSLENDIANRKSIEKMLRDSEEKYRLLAENATDVIWTMDFNGRFTYVSPSVEKLLGYTVDEIMRKSMEDVLTPASAVEARTKFAEAVESLRKGLPYQIFRDELENMCKTGRTVWTESTVSGIRSAAGEFTGVLGVTRDIGKRKRAENLIKARLELQEYAASNTIADVLRKTLDLVEDLTDSLISFYYFVESDQKTVSLKAWSSRTLKEYCKIDGSGMHNSIATAGVWSDCFYAGKPVIHNDYAALPHRKGMPEGHAAVTRQLVVPVFRKEGVVSILGVGNKPFDYEEEDAGLVSYFADMAWDVVQRKRTEEALKESETRYALTLDAVNDALWDWHVPGGKVFLSPAYYNMLGYENGAFVSSYVMWRSFISPEDIDRVENEMQKSIEDNGVLSSEFRMKMQSGRFRWVASRGKVVERDADGKALRIVGTISDISERKQTELYRGLSAEVLQILNESNSFRQSVSDILDVIKKTTGHDALGMRLQEGEDDPYYDQRGFDDEFLLTENSLAARDVNGSRTPCSDGKLMLECLCGLVLSGRTDPADPLFTTGGSFWTNDALNLPDLPYAEDPKLHLRKQCMQHGFSSIALVPIRARQKIIGLLQLNDRRKNQFTLSGITALESIASHIGEALLRRQTEAALQESESKYRLLVDQSSDVIWSLNAEGRFTYISPSCERITGYHPVSLLAMSFQAFVHPDDLEASVGYFQSMVDGDSTEISAEYRILHADGTWRWHAANATPVYGSDGRLVSMIGISRDVTEKKRVEEDLRAAKEKAEEASRAKSDFLSIMSHEIRTPLNAIIGMSELLGETRLDDDQQIYVRTFRNAGESLLSIINNILDYSKIEAGKVDVENTDFDLTDLMEKISAILALQAHKKHIELIMYIPSNVPTFLVGDQQHLRQVLMNLIGNAVKFTEQGEVTVRLEKVSGNRMSSTCEISFIVEDTGPGIAADKLPLIFERFSQTDSSVTRKFGGTGLGLAISRKLVEMMGGHIFVESRPGVGSKFYFTLSFGLQKDEVRKKRELDIDLKGLRVLVVDDNATNRLIVNRMLTPWGAAVQEAFDAKDAVKELKRLMRSEDAVYDLMIIDRHMPGMDGFELAEFVRSDPRLGAAKMIMMTSDSFNIDMVRVRKLGISGYLIKPVKKSDLKECIIRALQLESRGMETRSGAQTSPALRPLKILLVEDAENNRVLMRSYLKKTPFMVDEAENGQEAVEKFKAGVYDIVLMDVQMPVMDGYSATREIRRWEKEKDVRPTPVLALTAHVFKEDIRRSQTAGCDDHLTKPISKEALLKAILAHVPEGEVVNGEKITIAVDPDLRDLIPQFMENTRKDVDTIADALAGNDKETIRRISHSMKSYGSGYGFDYISKAGQAMEAAAVGNNLTGIGEILADLTDYLDRVTVTYKG